MYKRTRIKREGKTHSRKKKSILGRYLLSFGLIVIALSVFLCCGASLSSRPNNTKSLSAPKVDDTIPVSNNNDANSASPEVGNTVTPPNSGEANMSTNGAKHTTPVNNSASSESDKTEDHIIYNSNSEWNLILVNPWNSLPEDYSVTLTQLKNGQSVDERCYPDLQEMMDACRAAGLSPVICSSYRTQEYQEKLFNNKVDKLMAQGYSRAEAEKEAGSEVAVPGTSEHQLGLAVDIVDLNYQLLDRGQEETEVQKWLMEHCREYGFILRYPESKSEITGIIYEPWHYRYVGKEAAEEITEAGICLEEYLESIG